MAMTRSYRETVRARVEREPAFRDALLAEAVDSLIAGEVDVGKAMLRDFIETTVGFEKLSSTIGSSAASLKGMLSASGSPAAAALFTLIGEVQRSAGVRLEITPRVEVADPMPSRSKPLSVSAES